MDKLVQDRRLDVGKISIPLYFFIVKSYLMEEKLQDKYVFTHFFGILCAFI